MTQRGGWRRFRWPAPGERESLAILALVLLGVLAVALIGGINLGPRGWRAGWRCQFSLSEGFLCRPQPAVRLR